MKLRDLCVLFLALALLGLLPACSDDSGVPIPDDDDSAGDDDDDSAGDDDDDDSASKEPAVDNDGDGYLEDEDCNDDDSTISPAASELCDHVDNDCDGATDEPDATDAPTWYEDTDGDGYGVEGSSQAACAQPHGYSAYPGDCNDTDPAYHPGAIEADCSDPNDYNCDTSVGYADADSDGHAACEDCDDSNSAINPDATEACNAADDDCDGLIDETGATGTSSWYPDADGDNYGRTASVVEACTAPAGHVANAGDCDDLDPSSYPGATEVCDGADNNCDSQVDEGAAAPGTWHPDFDGDGFGNSSSPVVACTAPLNYIATGGDCDDLDASSYPGGIEVCDAADNNCDGTSDEGLLGPWYPDNDGDGFGGIPGILGCGPLPGTVSGAGDCDDSDDQIYPGATELCDGDDNDCDATTTAVGGENDGDGDGHLACDDCDDSDSAAHPGGTEICDGIDNDCDATTTTAPGENDGDGDSYLACNDCDDTNANVYPGGAELHDGVDSNCDGSGDETLGVGSGNDGSLTVTSTVNLSTHSSGTRTQPDAISFTVLAISGVTISLDTPALGLAYGDEVILINMHGIDLAHAGVGTYEFASVTSVAGSDVTLAAPPSGLYGESSNGTLIGQTIVLQRVPNYTSVTVTSAGVLSVDAWNGTSGVAGVAGTAGGLLAFRASAGLGVNSGGRITVDSAGYPGGATGSAYNCDSYQGESYAGVGEGDGDGACSDYNETTGQWNPNYGGGGAHITGGGGEYGGGATAGASWDGGGATAPAAGLEYGVSDLSLLFLGSGGGGVWTGNGGTPGPGGNGAGIIMIGADSISTASSGAISATGGSTTFWAIGSYTYGAAGGSGGSIYLSAETVNLASDSVQAEGGLGQSSYIRNGGNGGVGRIRIDCNTCNSFTQGSSGADSELANASSPNLGFNGTP